MGEHSNKVIIYHGGGCADGFTSAFIAWKMFGNEAEYIGALHGEQPPEAHGKDVYILDFSYPREQLEALAARAASLTIIDHHEKAVGIIKSAVWPEHSKVTLVLDMERSGAGLTWDFFHPRLPRLLLVDYVEDRDLWRFRMPNSKEVNAFIGVQDHTWDRWNLLAHQVNLETMLLADMGRGIVMGQIDYVEKVTKLARPVAIGGVLVPTVNVPHVHVSEVLDHLARHGIDGKPPQFAAGWFMRQDGVFQFSLRSRGEGANVNLVAQIYGGGGHKHAAGFQATWDSERALMMRVLGMSSEI